MFDEEFYLKGIIALNNIHPPRTHPNQPHDRNPDDYSRTAPFKDERPSLTCEHCRKKFTANPKATSTVYCSAKCREISQAIPPKACGECGKPISRALVLRGAETCSTRCRIDQQKKWRRAQSWSASINTGRKPRRILAPDGGQEARFAKQESDRVLLARAAECSSRELAAELNITVRSVYKRLENARARLKKRLEEVGC